MPGAKWSAGLALPRYHRSNASEEALQLSEQKRRQTQLLEAMGSLAGGIAHDFNNILGAILGYSEMALRDAPTGTRLRRDLENILTAGERGRALVDRVLTFSRNGVGDRIPVHVEKVVREALDSLADALPADINLEVSLEAGTAAMSGEPTQVHQIVIDLTTNGIQSMPSGGTLRVSLNTQSFDTEHAATVGTVRAADYLLLEISDSGTGIEPSILSAFSSRFSPPRRSTSATGSGLALVHGIVMDLGGAIDVVSTPGSGSTFTVYLPRTGDAPDANLEPGDHASPRGRGERIVVVDDEEPLVRLKTERLMELGYRAVGFTSSAAAIEAFRADPNGFDAVITDERMPEMSGSQLIREVRAIRRTVPILLVSGYLGGMVTRRAYNEGADEVLKKPLSERDLAAGLARVFRR